MKKKDVVLLCAASMAVWMAAGTGMTMAEEAFGESGADTVQNASETEIVLSDEMILVDGEPVSEDASAPVFTGAEIVYYKEGQNELYGEGDEADGHTEEEAAENTVVTITAPGTYRVTGSMSRGQIAVDLGEESREDASAVVNLILDQADITCSVAPAIVVYNAYECGSDDTETAVKDVDTALAGFQLILADGSENKVNGSHVAKIYKEGTTQEEVDSGEAKKQWKFDAAIDSLVSFNICGEELADGKLEVTADNEGISSALHMTMNGGELRISSADDAINTSEDGVSVLTINDGVIICAAGLGKEGDGIDSNGWIVQNGGYVISCADPDSQDSGVDSDLGIYINGGTLLASGNMYDEVSADSGQRFLVLNFGEQIEAGQLLMLKDSSDTPVAAFYAENSFTTMVYSSDLLEDGDYTFYKVSSVTGELQGSIYTDITGYEDEVQLQYSSSGMMGPGGKAGGFRGEMNRRPEDMEAGQRDGRQEGKERPDMPEGMEEGERPELPEGMDEGERSELPEGMEEGEQPELPEGIEGSGQPGMANGAAGSEPDTIFTVSGIQNTFSQITEAGHTEEQNIEVGYSEPEYSEEAQQA